MFILTLFTPGFHPITPYFYVVRRRGSGKKVREAGWAIMIFPGSNNIYK